MSVEPDVVQQDYPREEHRELKAMESKLPGAKLNANTLTRAFDDNRSVGSAKSQKPLSAALFFQNAVTKIAAPIGPACQVDTFPILDENCRTWFTDNDPYRSQVNAYGQISVYKSALPAKTDWREGSAAKSAKSKKQQPHQQMAAGAVPARPAGGRGGPPRPPAAVPIGAAAVIQ